MTLVPWLIECVVVERQGVEVAVVAQDTDEYFCAIFIVEVLQYIGCALGVFVVGHKSSLFSNVSLICRLMKQRGHVQCG